ncbi:type II toxin-antitoxin system RelE/ParE family toxin [Devosia sp. 63-57]|uniref:type II toxin-antitoxin system RelE/ParE family toxin n=1 Tax=Devosia sp. 63-57 TaxID=1895751 RepID=UPI0008692C07|nr:type II toxin-antitoxin system RelE/ParE family toxin [Devosia sp. 63-57]ODT47270.1 MAG: addiction module antitoxin RelB [Pelagibacterium sp. SCN 63-126]ODU89087.1 MAG: addiction module antitoxin RelB [Pelagibacterium sp. SCN 63-17]OJX43021.1 MAG: addiction module antitoxin RelB [Devosia sp. 63-57]
MIEVLRTEAFSDWIRSLKDLNARSRIEVRITRVEMGNLGDAKFFDGIGELRVDYGPGYRVYFVRRGDKIMLLLCGGDKSSQAWDIKTAKAMAEELK